MENDDLILSDRYLRGLGGAVLGGAALFAYFAQSILPFATPLDLVLGSAAFATAIVAIWSQLNSATSDRQILFCVISASALMMAFFFIVIYPAMGRARDHDRRCLVIERQMFPDSPDAERMSAIFAALQCRPQPDRI